MVDAVLGPEIAAHFHRVFAQFPRDAAIERDPVGWAGHDIDQALPAVQRPHDLPRSAAERRRRIVGMERQPHARFRRDRNHGFQEISDVRPHLVERVHTLFG